MDEEVPSPVPTTPVTASATSTPTFTHVASPFTSVSSGARPAVAAGRGGSVERGAIAAAAAAAAATSHPGPPPSTSLTSSSVDRQAGSEASSAPLQPQTPHAAVAPRSSSLIEPHPLSHHLDLNPASATTSASSSSTNIPATAVVTPGPTSAPHASSPPPSNVSSTGTGNRAPPKRGAPPNTVVQAAFTRFQKEGFKTDFARCRYCGKERAWHTTDLQKHLLKCEAYRAQFPDAEPAFRRKRRREGSGVGGASIGSAAGISAPYGAMAGRASSMSEGIPAAEEEEMEGIIESSAHRLPSHQEHDEAEPTGRLRRVETLLRQVLGGQDVLGAKVEELTTRLTKLEARVGGLQDASASLYGGLANMAANAQREVALQPQAQPSPVQSQAQQQYSRTQQQRYPREEEEDDDEESDGEQPSTLQAARSTEAAPGYRDLAGAGYRALMAGEEARHGRLIQPRPPTTGAGGEYRR